MEDPEDQVVTVYCNLLCSSVSCDLKKKVFYLHHGCAETADLPLSEDVPVFELLRVLVGW